MFTGIVKGLCRVDAVESNGDVIRYALAFPKEWLQGLQRGASISVDGVCQTATLIEDQRVWFDAIEETLRLTTLKDLYIGRLVNMERAARFGDEIGGHPLSGHIYGTGHIQKIEKRDNTQVITLKGSPEWTKYLFTKGYIALDGVSLTLGHVDPAGSFQVHLIPETLRVTTLGFKKAGGLVNIEFDSQTQAIVDTVEKLLEKKF